MKLMFLSLGDVAQPLSSSGTPFHLYRALCAEFEEVRPCSADLGRGQRWLNYLASFSPDASFWRERSYKNSYSFAAQTANAARVVRRERADYILQFQTMFAPLPALAGLQAPLGIYTDYTIAMARREYPLWAPFRGEREYRSWHEKERALFEKARDVFTFSSPVRDSVVTDYGIAPGKVHCVRAGTAFQPLPQRGAPGPATRFLLVGRDYRRKGVESLLRAFSELRAIYPEITLHIVGCSIGQDLPGVVNTPLESDRGRLRQIFASADAFVLPSVAEPFGYVFIEAMSSGLPCIGTRTGGVPDIIVEGETGFLVPVGDTGALREKMERLILDPDLAARLGRGGMERFSREYQWDLVVQKMATVIRGGRLPLSLAA